jgi:segregation and condensation protein B
VLFTLNRAVTLLELQDILQSPLPDIEAAASTLAGSLEGSGLFLQRHQDQLQLVTDPAQADMVRRVLRPEYPSRLSPAAYETLAIIAYRQPLTRARIEEIRGVNCEAVLESLEEKGLIQETGRMDAPGMPRLFGTTMKFLQILGLPSLDELPALPQSGSTTS